MMLGIVKDSTIRCKNIGGWRAEKMGADAIVNIRYATSSIMQGAAGVIVYGTAVKVKA
ncbi:MULTISPECIES: heavy metal-binding domain-containing protein [Caproicibacterium]|jgi:uncharacterized protein YbjQ (UPF0145 family)|uniref:Heavy metal-binding domain-containing protein n=1 Tax=Caproicibacterium lactatifermentans TaxID=2666138 RepID=A0A859DS75_9FIRM|nr:heavy metal-binding domain-containing protein [Caproicibacterium lactatifermentans]ARP49940.1 hypothetical protein B6259_02980 [Ruminococcaceae bacterium CPB6]MDD4807686.1 heavy metal-binding domain-containing protein [Oscillospiraceae bacterium]QKN24339.1 heavy metal-binding domain-containing protein [Caproicibacterium lactatifermentans]QKO30647.1 heavy metal-binding domain-containing protein [Caproicibacterium lactatifermentans]